MTFIVVSASNAIRLLASKSMIIAINFNLYTSFFDGTCSGDYIDCSYNYCYSEELAAITVLDDTFGGYVTSMECYYCCDS